MEPVAACRHFGRCGGCQWQDVAYPEQLRRKRAALDAVLQRHAVSACPPADPVVGMPVGVDGQPWAFRHKSAFVFAPGPTGSLVMGHFAAGGREVIAVDECPVHSARANRIAFALRDELVRARVPAAGPHLDGVLRHLIVRTSADDRDAVAMLVVTRNAAGLRRPIRAFLDSAERPNGFFVNIHPRPSVYMVGRETLRIDGHATVRERSLGPTFLVSPTAFFQTNPTAAAALAALVTEEVGREPRRVLDLYSGGGLFTVPLAMAGHHVLAVEENVQAVSDAVKNLEVNRVAPRSVRLVRARVEDAMSDVVRQAVDVVILDPPRQGCAPAVIQAVFADLRPARAIYVSCNPDALAADLPAIGAAGYRPARVRPVDMFPHTPLVEAVVVFERDASPSRRPPAAKSGKMRTVR